MNYFDQITKGYFSSIYFHKAQKISKNFKNETKITCQYWQRNQNSVLCGINEVILFLQKVLKNNADVSVLALQDGMTINNREPVLQITGPYHHFALYEGIIDGYLSRQTSIASNAAAVKKAAKNKPIIYMADRADDYRLLEDDAYAAYIGGLNLQTVPIQKNRAPVKIMGTIPHALIQLFNGDLIKTLSAYHKTYPDEDLVALIDFHNNVIHEALKVARHFGKILTMVRVDTAPNLVDKFFENKANPQFGVNPTLIKALRNALNTEGFQHVKIAVSSGFNTEKIAYFEKELTPVDVYGVGANLVQIKHHFTCDSVLLNGLPVAKTGRTFQKNTRLKKVI